MPLPKRGAMRMAAYKRMEEENAGGLDNRRSKLSKIEELVDKLEEKFARYDNEIIKAERLKTQRCMNLKMPAPRSWRSTSGWRRSALGAMMSEEKVTLKISICVEPCRSSWMPIPPPPDPA